jgi:hypothetical protein
MKKLFYIMILALLFQSCSTIHYRFDNTPNGDGDSEWHHIGIFQLVTFSSPARIRRICRDGVHEITSRKSPFQAVISVIPWLGWAWSPTEISYECAEKVANNSVGPVNKNNNENKSENNNNNTININISPDSFNKKKKAKEKTQ